MNPVGFTVSKSTKSIEAPAGKPLLHKYGSSILKKCVWNYRAAVGMVSYLQGSTRPEISMAVH